MIGVNPWYEIVLCLVGFVVLAIFLVIGMGVLAGLMAAKLADDIRRRLRR